MYLDFTVEASQGFERSTNRLLNLLSQFGQIYVPDGEDEQDAYQHASRGKCMACGQPLAEDTIVLISGIGVVGLWDSPECCANMHALSFLREVEEAVVEAIEQRESEDG